jgi:hypothetical protein
MVRLRSGHHCSGKQERNAERAQELDQYSHEFCIPTQMPQEQVAPDRELHCVERITS